MKRFSLFVLAFLLLAASAFAIVPGATVEVEWNGSWYPATVLKSENGKYFIHYEGYDNSWDEWVTNSRIKSGDSDQSKAAESPLPRKAATTPKPVSAAPVSSEIIVRKGGMLWASIAPDGVIRINGSMAGEFSGDGTVRKNGSIVGEVDSSGTIRKSGSIAGAIEAGGTFRKSGSIIGSIEANGTIRKGGSLWGEASSCCSSHADKIKISALLVFFVADFGF